MKTTTLLLPAFIVALLFGCFQAVNAQSRETELPKSMKGYEIYSWKIRGEWHFSLLIGTNRLKTRSEVTSTKVRIKGINALKKKLNQLPRGEQVSMPARVPRMILPSKEIIKEIKTYCDQLGIVLLVAAPV